MMQRCEFHIISSLCCARFAYSLFLFLILHERNLHSQYMLTKATELDHFANELYSSKHSTLDESHTVGKWNVLSKIAVACQPFP